MKKDHQVLAPMTRPGSVASVEDLRAKRKIMSAAISVTDGSTFGARTSRMHQKSLFVVVLVSSLSCIVFL